MVVVVCFVLYSDFRFIDIIYEPSDQVGVACHAGRPPRPAGVELAAGEGLGEPEAALARAGGARSHQPALHAAPVLNIIIIIISSWS